MARRARHTEHENHERWLVSYADFITLLFAFFVVMFASSQADKAKARAVSESVSKAFEKGGVQRVAEILSGTPVDRAKTPAAKEPETKPQPLSESLEVLASDLKKEIGEGKVSVTMEARGLVISLKQAAFFASGDDQLLAEASSSLEKIAKIVIKLPNQIRLEGHTDALPISNSKFRNNWELSSARGISVLQWLSGKCAVPLSRMAVVAYAENVPKSPNDTEAGRGQNRRVDITILNDVGVKQEAGLPAKPNPTIAAIGH